MNKPVPNNKEAHFDIEELFFSTTNHEGIILSGNDVFQRTSGYKWDQLNQAPHNIIRHPEMPGCVFKLLWDKIKAGNPITAYIKNMAADGSYYWVLASVFPVKEGYISIRMKPTSDLFKSIGLIYANVLNYEKEKGLDEGLNYLISEIAKAGFPSYERFMATALIEEMKARQVVLTDRINNGDSQHFNQNFGANSSTVDKIFSFSNTTIQEYLDVFKKINDFDESKKFLEDKTAYLLDSFQDFELISLNMRVFAALLGEEGASLGVIATEFREIVGSIEKHFRTFETTVVDLSKMMNSASLQICYSKLQFDMIDFFVKESLRKSQGDSSSAQDSFHMLEVNTPKFLELTKMFYSIIEKEMHGLHSEITKFVNINKEIKKFVNGLEVIAQMGSVESARLNSNEQSFNVYIKRMEEFNNILKSSSNELNKTIQALDLNQSYVAATIKHTVTQIDEIFRLALEIKALTEQNKSAA